MTEDAIEIGLRPPGAGAPNFNVYKLCRGFQNPEPEGHSGGLAMQGSLAADWKTVRGPGGKRQFMPGNPIAVSRHQLKLFHPSCETDILSQFWSTLTWEGKTGKRGVADAARC